MPLKRLNQRDVKRFSDYEEAAMGLQVVRLPEESGWFGYVIGDLVFMTIDRTSVEQLSGLLSEPWMRGLTSRMVWEFRTNERSRIGLRACPKRRHLTTPFRAASYSRLVSLSRDICRRLLHDRHRFTDTFHSDGVAVRTTCSIDASHGRRVAGSTKVRAP